MQFCDTADSKSALRLRCILLAPSSQTSPVSFNLMQRAWPGRGYSFLPGWAERPRVSPNSAILMKRALLTIVFTASLFAAASLRADDAASLGGKWSVKKTNDRGDKYTQTIEVKKDKFVFEIRGAEDQVVIHAEGDLKFEKLGPFSAVRFTHIRAGSSATDLNDVEDEYASVYRLDGDKWTVASNFDKDRENQKPGTDIYTRATK